MPDSSATTPEPSDPPDPSDSAHRPPWASSLFVRGVGLGFPIFLGYVPVGLAFGILARALGFSVLAATTCSATALAGAGQFIALAVMGSGSSAFEVLVATTVVNLRYVLFASTLSPYLRGLSLPTQTGLAFSLTDETFAINIADQRAGTSSVPSMLGVGAIAWVGWVLGTTLGAAGSSWIGDPARFGVQFAMPAMFTALFVALAEHSRHVVIGVVAGVIALALPLASGAHAVISPSWLIIISSMSAATIGSVVWRDD
jgi:4-azaleucine resistance transporter AzlC